MEKIRPRVLSGFMELLPQEQIRFNAFLEKLGSVYSLYGFTPLDTPLIEASEILLAKGGGETEKQIYRFVKGDSDLSLRFDLTVPLARYVAEHANDLAFPFRRYQIGKVYRGERAQRGRFREFYQADIDVIGDGKLDIMNDAEIPAIIYDVFSSLGLKDFVIRVNNRKILNGFFEMIGEKDRAGDIMRTVDKLEKIGPDKVISLLLDLGVSEENASRITGFISTSDDKLFPVLGELAGANEVFDAGLSELRAVCEGVAALGVPEDNFRVDLTIARGLDYYTGTVYETSLKKHPEIGSICSGGRYDNLAEHYTDRHLPGVGISIGLTRLFYILNEQGLLNPDFPSSPADVLIAPMTENGEKPAEIAARFRKAGIRTQLYTEKKKPKAKIGYADKLGIPYVVFIGDDEIARGTVTLKNLLTGEQSEVTPSEAAELIKSGLNEKSKNLPIRE
ncbi:MAG: histidine--tRNA ligase [Clostridia bacterium]|nr:histidine--tRNA ligase [Clostridia bacterium]